MANVRVIYTCYTVSGSNLQICNVEISIRTTATIAIGRINRSITCKCRVYVSIQVVVVLGFLRQSPSSTRNMSCLVSVGSRHPGRYVKNFFVVSMCQLKFFVCVLILFYSLGVPPISCIGGLDSYVICNVTYYKIYSIKGTYRSVVFKISI